MVFVELGLSSDEASAQSVSDSVESQSDSVQLGWVLANLGRICYCVDVPAAFEWALDQLLKLLSWPLAHLIDRRQDSWRELLQDVVVQLDHVV